MPESLAPAYDYLAFGLRLRSELALPELRPAGDGDAAPDATIARAALTGEGWDRIVSLDRDWFRLALPEVGRFEVRGGTSILADPDPDAPSGQVRAYLLGSVIGALLQQRGLLTLHASAVAIQGGAVALLGESGAGKSTLAMQLNRHGHALLCDDIFVVAFDSDARPVAWPGISRLKLWSQTLAAAGTPTDGLEPVLQKEDKFHVPAGHVADYRPHPLRAIYLLRRDENPGSAIRRLKGAEAVNALMSHTYRGRMVPFMQATQSHFRACLQLLEHCGVFELPRGWGLDRLAEGVHAIEHHLQGR